MASQTTIHESEQNVLNKSFNPTTGLLQVETLGTDGVGSRVEPTSVVNMKIVEDGLTTYIAIAAPGTAEATNKWQCKKIVDSGTGTITITWYNGGSFTGVATNLASLSYA